LLSPLRALDPNGSKVIKFDVVDVKPHLHYHVEFRIHVEGMNKGKVVASPSSPSNDSSKHVSSDMQLKDDCSHVISEIQPQGSNQPQTNFGNQRWTTMIKEKFPLGLASMDFSLCVFIIELIKTLVCRKFGQEAFF
jgi:hypothetical protein